MLYARSTTRKRTNVARKPRTRSGYRKRRSPATYQARLNYSRKRYNRNKKIANMLSKFSETKFKAITRIDEQAPVPIQLGALAHMANFVVGVAAPSTWTDFTPLDGMNINQGVTDQNRVGACVYLKKTRLAIEIDMKQPAGETNTTLPCEFRVIAFKSRRQANPAGASRVPQTALFLDEVANDFGHATSGINGTDLMVQPINRRHFTVYKDMKFMLSNPLDPQLASAYSGKYPVMKRIYLDLPHYIKAHFEDSNSPTNYDFSYGLCIISRSLDKDTKADNWEVNIRGTTTFMDN